ncbi:MAG: class I SAM-dependent rRNA methyltransferase, partial [Planctomycetes bacterium]|nr:class I SAM-dependent rRNA methyltransferase [Planctomycetota bacterium]
MVRSMTTPIVRSSDSPVVLRLNRDLVRTIKRGHSWVFADALRDLPKATRGSPAVLLDNRKGVPIANGFYDSNSVLAFRVCDPDGQTKLDDRWAVSRLDRALTLRQSLFDETTTGYRYVNGEGDQMPGLVIDLYGPSAVIKLDGDGPSGFWNSEGIAEWIADKLKLEIVYERYKQKSAGGRFLVGSSTEVVEFQENSIQWTADIIHGQKTGFFLDQRDNRRWIRQIAENKNVLNLFSYTGGFSVASGIGRATDVTSV